MSMLFDDDECYQLFIAVDNTARERPNHPGFARLREMLLPFYSEWHQDNPHRVHPSALCD